MQALAKAGRINTASSCSVLNHRVVCQTAKAIPAQTQASRRGVLQALLLSSAAAPRPVRCAALDEDQEPSTVLQPGSIASPNQLSGTNGAPSTSSGSPSSNGASPTSASSQPPADAAAKDDDFPAVYYRAPGRIVAIGDLHGDINKAIQSLTVAGVLAIEDGRPTWIGGNTTVVQMGDVLDRGDVEIGIIQLLRELDRLAKPVGGAVFMLNGNHESLNVAGDFRYVTPGAFLESTLAAGVKDERAYDDETQIKVRFALYSPGGAMAKELARNPTVLIVNDTVFAHGGLLPEHINYGLQRINREVCQWMRGDQDENGRRVLPPLIAMGDPQSVMWTRLYSKERFASEYDRYRSCALLTQALDLVNAKRMVVGHTPQMSGCNCECDARIWRIDVGMSSGVLDATPEILEINLDPITNESLCKVMVAEPSDLQFTTTVDFS